MVKRTALLVGLPAVLLVLWLADQSGSSHSAKVDIVADHPTEFRRTVIATVVGLGGERIGEETSFGGRGASELRFAVPTGRLEEALDALGRLGGEITDQQVDLADASDEARSVADQLDDARRCIDRADVTDPAALAACQADLDQASGRLGSAKVDLATATLAVDIQPTGVSNPALVIAIVLLIAGAIGAAVLVWRMTRIRHDDEVDLRDFDDYQSGGDLHLRRN